jgi:hypothetical protein
MGFSRGEGGINFFYKFTNKKHNKVSKGSPNYLGGEQTWKLFSFYFSSLPTAATHTKNFICMPQLIVVTLHTYP